MITNSTIKSMKNSFGGLPWCELLNNVGAPPVLCGCDHRTHRCHKGCGHPCNWLAKTVRSFEEWQLSYHRTKKWWKWEKGPEPCFYCNRERNHNSRVAQKWYPDNVVIEQFNGARS